MLQVHSLIACILLVCASNSFSFQLSPEGAAVERNLVKLEKNGIGKVTSQIAKFGVEKFGESVHEEITNRIYGCKGEQTECRDPLWEPGLSYILAGVRWNDDPPFRFNKDQGKYYGCKSDSVIRLTTYPECWIQVFRDGKKRAERNEPINRTTAPILLRSHFGDLQFFHSMANQDGDEAEQTRIKILMWARLTWSVATRKVGPGDIVADINQPVVNEVFFGHGWSVQDLFAQGNVHIQQPKYLADVAFGSLLHMVQDSFSSGHVERKMPVVGTNCKGMSEEIKAPGKIVEFHSYRNQDSDEHKADDIRNAFMRHWTSTDPSVVDVGKKLVEYYNDSKDWDVVGPYLECIFDLAPDARNSSAGQKYEKI